MPAVCRCAPTLILLVVGCVAPMPLLQRAEPINGTSVCASARTGSGRFAYSEGGADAWDWTIYVERARVTTGGLYWEAGDGTTSGSFEVEFGRALWTSGARQSRRFTTGHVQVSAKRRIGNADTHLSYLVSIGYPRAIDGYLLWDVVPPVTAAVGLGLTGLSASFGIHCTLWKVAVVHAALAGTYYFWSGSGRDRLVAGLGLAVGFVRFQSASLPSAYRS